LRAIKRSDRTYHFTSAPAWLTHIMRRTGISWQARMATGLTTHPSASSYLSIDVGDHHPRWDRHIWTGIGILYGTPPHHLHKALRWAIASSMYTSTPSATFVLLPDKHHTRIPWLMHPSVRPILTTTSPALCTANHAAYYGATDTYPHPIHPSITLYLISNPAAQPMTSGILDALQTQLHQWPGCQWHTQPPAYPPTPSHPGMRDVRFRFLTPKRLRDLLATPNTEPVPQPTHTPHPTRAQTRSLPPPRWDTSTHVYTDGSSMTIGSTTICGAGIYVTRTQQGYTVNPSGKGPTNTINRAELAGILGALRDVIPKDQPATILSDSLCSLSMTNCSAAASGLPKAMGSCMRSTMAGGSTGLRAYSKCMGLC